MLGLVLYSLLVFSGADHVIECGTNSIRWLSIDHVNLAYKDTGIVGIHIILQTLLHIGGHSITTRGQNLIHEVATNYVANSRFRRVIQTKLWVLHRDHILHWILNQILHGDCDVDDVFIGSQHRAIFIGLRV